MAATSTRRLSRSRGWPPAELVRALVAVFWQGDQGTRPLVGRFLPRPWSWLVRIVANLALLPTAVLRDAGPAPWRAVPVTADQEPPARQQRRQVVVDQVHRECRRLVRRFHARHVRIPGEARLGRLGPRVQAGDAEHRPRQGHVRDYGAASHRCARSSGATGARGSRGDNTTVPHGRPGYFGTKWTAPGVSTGEALANHDHLLLD